MEAAIPITVVLALESTRPPVNPKKRTKEDLDREVSLTYSRQGFTWVNYFLAERFL